MTDPGPNGVVAKTYQLRPNINPHLKCHGDKDRRVDPREACGHSQPWNAPHDDIALARRRPLAETFVGILNDQIVASVLRGSDAHRTSVYYFAKMTKHQKTPPIEVDGT